MEKDKWIKEVMQSLQGKEDVTAPLSLQQKMEAKISALPASAKVVSLRTIGVAACAACVLMIANVQAFKQVNHKPQATSGQSETPDYSSQLHPSFSIDY